MHGLLEYAAAILFIAAPFLLDFEENAATAASIVVGVLILILSASTAMSTGIIKSIPVQAHVILDYLLAIALIAAPFVLGSPTTARRPCSSSRSACSTCC